jgi:hypothetical protein
MSVRASIMAGLAPPSPPTPNPPPPPYSCPDGWVAAVADGFGVVGSKCYKHVGEPMNMHQCEAACGSAGGSMLCISSIEENVGLYTAFVEEGHCENSDSTSCVWLGLTNSVDVC